MKIIFFFIGLFVSVFSYGECPVVSPEVDALIKRHADEVRGGEYCKYREVLKADNVEIVLYTIEGPCYKNENSPSGSCGNNFFRNMVGVVDGKEYERVMIGGKGAFLSKNIKMVKNTIEIEGLSYSSSDAMCCPSISSSRIFKIENGSFVEVKP